MNQNSALLKTFCCTTLLMSASACTTMHQEVASTVESSPVKVQPIKRKKIVLISQLDWYEKTHTQLSKDTQYLLQMGGFKRRSYATEYQHRLQSQTDRPVQMVPSKHNPGLFLVFVGPFEQVDAMVQTGRKLSHNSLKAKPAIQKTRVAIRPAPIVVPTVLPNTKKVVVVQTVSTNAKKTLVVARQPQLARKSIVTHPVSPIKKSTTTQVHKPVVVRTATNTRPVARHVTTQPMPTTKPLKTAVWKDMDEKPLFQAGPYVGGSIGLQSNVSGSGAIYKGFGGTLSAGWGRMWTRRFYFAAEAFGSESANLKNIPVPSSPVLKSVWSGWSFGGDIIPGYMLTDTVLGYLRAGVIRTQFVQMGQQSTGWQVGLGGQTNLCKNLDLRAEYIFNLYESIPNLGKQQADQFNLGVVYKFPYG